MGRKCWRFCSVGGLEFLEEREGEERQPAELVRMFIVQCEGSVIFYRELPPTI